MKRSTAVSWRILTTACTLLSVAGCSVGGIPLSAPMPDTGVPSVSLNTDIRVWTPEGLNSYRINEPIGLAIEVVGSDQVVFTRDFGNRIFQYVDEDWVELESVPTEWGEGMLVVSPSDGDPMAWAATEVFPWFDEPVGRVLLRVFVQGTRYRDGAPTDENVGAYVDIELTG